MVQKKKVKASERSGAKHGILSDRRVHLLVILIIGAIAYSNTFSVPFQWDDLTYIVENPIIKQLHYFIEPSDAKGLQFYDHFVQRYVTYLSFAFNYVIHGYNVTGYHFVNLAVHLINALLVYLLFSLTFRTPLLKASAIKDGAELAALFAAILFVSHPLQTMAVTYIYQRLASLVTLFYLLSLVSYLKSRMSRKAVQRILFYGVSFLSAVVAMKSKENAFTLPLVIVLFEFFFFTGEKKKRALQLIPFVFALLIIPLSLTGEEGSGHAGIHTDNKTLSREVYFFTQFRVLVMYVRLLFLPVRQSVLHDIYVSHSFFELNVILSFLFLIGMLCLGLTLFLRSRTGSPELRIVAFGIFWFFLTHSVESSFIPLLLAQEYRMYLPSVGLFMSISTAALLMFHKSGVMRTVVIACVIAVPLILTSLTYSRNTVWQTRLGLWEDVVSRAPNDPIANFNLGVAYTENGLIDKSKMYYERAILLKPDYARAYNNLGCIYGQKNNPDKAIELLLLALEKDRNLAIAHYNLGLAYILKRQLGEAKIQLRLALKLNPGLKRAQGVLTRLEQKRG